MNGKKRTLNASASSSTQINKKNKNTPEVIVSSKKNILNTASTEKSKVPVTVKKLKASTSTVTVEFSTLESIEGN